MGRIGFQPVMDAPVWNSSTVEFVSSIAGGDKITIGGASDTITIPSGAYFVIFSTDQNHPTGIYLSPDNTDVDSGIRFADSGADVSVPMAIKDDMVMTAHNASGGTAIQLNAVFFVNED